MHIDNLFKASKGSAHTIYQYPANLDRFKMVESISLLYQYDAEILSFYCKHIPIFCRINKIEIEIDVSDTDDKRRADWTNMIRNLLLQNMNHLTAIKIFTRWCMIGESVEPWIWSLLCENNKNMSTDITDATDGDIDSSQKSLIFPQLRKIELKDVNLYSFPKILNEKGLKILKISGYSYLAKGFWNDLIKYEKNLSNVEEISLNGCFVHKDDIAFMDQIVFPMFCARIAQQNLRKFECVKRLSGNMGVTGKDIGMLTWLNLFMWQSFGPYLVTTEPGDGKIKQINYNCDESKDIHNLIVLQCY